MQELYNKLKNYTIEDTIKIEESDRQYIALKNMWENFKYSPNISQRESDKASIYLSLILANSIICYQLSGKGEDYWEEFGNYFGLISSNFFDEKKGPLPNMLLTNDAGLVNVIIRSLSSFIKQSRNNKRFVDVKINRLEKLKPFLEEFIGNTEYYYVNMEELVEKLAKTMKQKKDAKTIVFAVKMFSYGARNVFDKLVYFPGDITIPVDSRLENLYNRYKSPNPIFLSSGGGTKGINIKDIKKFYFELSKKLNIPELHLDALVWVNYDELMK